MRLEERTDGTYEGPALVGSEGGVQDGEVIRTSPPDARVPEQVVGQVLHLYPHQPGDSTRSLVSSNESLSNIGESLLHGLGTGLQLLEHIQVPPELLPLSLAVSLIEVEDAGEEYDQRQNPHSYLVGRRLKRWQNV